MSEVDNATKTEVFKSVLLMAARWKDYWTEYQAKPSTLRPHARLAAAVSNFMFKEFRANSMLEPLDDDAKYSMAIALLGKAVPRSRTHSEDFVNDTFALMGIGKVGTRFPAKMTLLIHRKLNSRFKRLVLLTLPFFAVVDLFLLKHDMDHYGWEPSLPFALAALATLTCLLLAFTDLGEWVGG
jgi:hypothetical protein